MASRTSPLVLRTSFREVPARAPSLPFETRAGPPHTAATRAMGVPRAPRHARARRSAACSGTGDGGEVAAPDNAACQRRAVRDL